MLPTPQCDQIALFLIDLNKKFSYQSTPNIWSHFCYFEKHNILVKATVATFWAACGNILVPY